MQTEELTRLQVGEHSKTPAQIIVSTVLEAENIVPVLKEFQGKGRKVNVSNRQRKNPPNVNLPA